MSTAVLLGWRVLRFTPDMVTDGKALEYIEMALGARDEIHVDPKR